MHAKHKAHIQYSVSKCYDIMFLFWLKMYFNWHWLTWKKILMLLKHVSVSYGLKRVSVFTAFKVYALHPPPPQQLLSHKRFLTIFTFILSHRASIPFTNCILYVDAFTHKMIWHTVASYSWKWLYNQLVNLAGLKVKQKVNYIFYDNLIGWHRPICRKIGAGIRLKRRLWVSLCCSPFLLYDILENVKKKIVSNALLMHKLKQSVANFHFKHGNSFTSTV